MTILRARALLFDMDGTLVDSTAVVEQIWADFSAAHGLDLAEVLAYSHGRQSPDTLRHFMPHLTDAEVAAHRNTLEDNELDDVVGIVEVAGAGSLLTSLEGIPWAVVTSATRELATKRLRAAGILDVPLLVPADEIDKGKPHPEGYLRAAELLGVPAAECVVFEDAGAGIEAGLAAGAQVVVVGALDSPAARGLPRVADLSRVTAAKDAAGGVVVDLG